MPKIHLGDGLKRKRGYSYNPRMKRWVRRKKKGRGFEIRAYHKGS